jgi:lipopolysaccharide export system protein LptC
VATNAPKRGWQHRWAEPGSAHDRLVRWAKIGLPSAVGALIAILAVAPLGKHSDVSFILDKKKVEKSSSSMRVESARYVGTDNKGQQFTMVANHAIQHSSNVPLVDISGIMAQLNLSQGPVLLAANQGRYNLDTKKVAIDGPVKVAGANGYRLATSDVTVDLNQRQMQSAGPVAGEMRLGQFQAGHLRADLGERTVTLDGGARLKIVQGAVR